MGLESFTEGYGAGYDAAFFDIRFAMKSVYHRDTCGKCKSCTFLWNMMDYVVSHVSGHMTKEERVIVFKIFSDCYERIQDDERWWASHV